MLTYMIPERIERRRELLYTRKRYIITDMILALSQQYTKALLKMVVLSSYVHMTRGKNLLLRSTARSGRQDVQLQQSA